MLHTCVLRTSAASCLEVDYLCGQTALEFASYLVIARRNPGQNGTVHDFLITMEDDKLTLIY